MLEAGCGVGAQTVTLSSQNPDAAFTSIDISLTSLEVAERSVRESGATNVYFEQADILDLKYPDDSFDHVFLCYVLEHLPDPITALQALRRVLRPGGTIITIEGDHGSCYFHPTTPAARQIWQCLIDVQRRLGGNSLIGRELFPRLSQSEFSDIQVSPRMVYADHSLPHLIKSFVDDTIIRMVDGVREKALEFNLSDEHSWKMGIQDLKRVVESKEGTFCYTFFKAIGTK